MPYRIWSVEPGPDGEIEVPDGYEVHMFLSEDLVEPDKAGPYTLYTFLLRGTGR